MLAVREVADVTSRRVPVDSRRLAAGRRVLVGHREQRPPVYGPLTAVGVCYLVEGVDQVVLVPGAHERRRKVRVAHTIDRHDPHRRGAHRAACLRRRAYHGPAARPIPIASGRARGGETGSFRGKFLAALAAAPSRSNQAIDSGGARGETTPRVGAAGGTRGWLPRCRRRASGARPSHRQPPEWCE